MAQDKKLVCKDCGSDFLFTASEQDFFAEKGFSNEPGRCHDCRRARKDKDGFNRGGGGSRQREMHSVTCSACGTNTEVPFRPSGERPVYCKDCFSQNNKRY